MIVKVDALQDTELEDGAEQPLLSHSQSIVTNAELFDPAAAVIRKTLLAVVTFLLVLVLYVRLTGQPSSRLPTVAIETNGRGLADSDLTQVLGWNISGIRERAPMQSPWPQQTHTAICIHFNSAPEADGLATVLKMQMPLHRYVTIISPTSVSDLPMPLPESLHYIECVPGSVVNGDVELSPEKLGFKGALQHVCAVACLEHHTSVPGIRGVIFQSDDMFVNYTMIFDDVVVFPSIKIWSPSVNDQYVVSLTNEAILENWDSWTRFPVGNLFLLRRTAEYLQTLPKYRQAWQLAYDGFDKVSGKVIADFFYVPHKQLQTVVDITLALANTPEQYVVVPDTTDLRPEGNQSESSITLRMGLSMSEWWIATLLRLTAALTLLDDHHTRDRSAFPRVLTHIGPWLSWSWGSERENITRMRALCFHLGDEGMQTPAVVHPLKLLNPAFRQIYVEGYQVMRRHWLNRLAVRPTGW